MPQKVNAEVCPHCGSRDLNPSRESPGFWACGSCGRDPLAQLKREGIFGEMIYYVDPNRSSAQVVEAKERDRHGG